MEAKAQDMEAPAQSFAIFFKGNTLKYVVIFAHKGKSNTSFGTVKGLSQYQQNVVLLRKQWCAV